MQKFSALLSLYASETPSHLQQCLQSIVDQTLQPDEIVMVLDGPISDDLRAVIDNAELPQMEIIPLAENVGLGAALNEGLAACSNELVARVDTDDINLPHRFETQVTYMINNPSVAVASAHVEEFGTGVASEIRIRKVPITSDQIQSWIRRRCPMNHPAVIFRKSIVAAVGNYPSQRYAQDYQLWIKIFSAGYQLANIDEVLVRFRVGHDFYEKRGGLRYVPFDYQLQQSLLRNNIIGPMGFISNMAIRVTARLIPNSLRRFIYTILRKKS